MHQTQSLCAECRLETVYASNETHSPALRIGRRFGYGCHYGTIVRCSVKTDENSSCLMCLGHFTHFQDMRHCFLGYLKAKSVILGPEF
jgi:hypothetical protein